MRLSHLTALTLLLMFCAAQGVIYAGRHPLVFPTGQAKKWDQCSKPSDNLSRDLCAEFR